VSPKLEHKLYKDFPKLFAQKDLPKEQTCMCWGIECPDEWFEVIYVACNLIQTMTDLNPDTHPQVQFTQVKEKFGSLCMYNNTNTGYVNGVLAMADRMVQKLSK
jgi:hypothetical protein